MTQLPIFKLEDYLSTREFSSPYMFGSSDAESWSMKEIVGMADEECQTLWENLGLGYTETQGLPLLREEIAKQYNKKISAANIGCFAGAEEGIYAACHTLLNANEHAIVITPAYQSLESVPASICEVTSIALSPHNNWELDLSLIEGAVQPNTKLLLINFPHNPTGTIISHEQQMQLVELARSKNIWIFSDEVYRFLELNPNDRLPPMADMYEKGISLGVMSKAYGLAGLRIGWITCQDHDTLMKCLEMKHYLTICNSAPSEILSLIALRNSETLLERNHKIMTSNIKLLDAFFEEYSDVFEWVRPKGGCIGFPRLKQDMSAYDFCEQLRFQKGVVALPNTVYDFKGNHIRVGFGRKNMPEALEKVKEFSRTLEK